MNERCEKKRTKSVHIAVVVDDIQVEARQIRLVVAAHGAQT